MAAQANVLRDLFGNPFRSVSFDPSWASTNVLSLARHIYEGRDYSLMPILADALMDEGCDDEAMLSHCRGPNEHIRGCWLLDLLLGKTVP